LPERCRHCRDSRRDPDRHASREFIDADRFAFEGIAFDRSDA